MINFFKKKNMETIENPLSKIAALLIHVAKIDENYTEKEREIIKKAIIGLGAKNELGIIVEATFKLLPLPERCDTHFFLVSNNDPPNERIPSAKVKSNP